MRWMTLLDQLLQLLANVVFAALGLVAEQLVHYIRRQDAAAEQRFENRIVQRLHRAIHPPARVPRIVEPAREQQIAQFRHELVHVEVVERVGDVL